MCKMLESLFNVLLLLKITDYSPCASLDYLQEVLLKGRGQDGPHSQCSAYNTINSGSV